MRIRRLQDGASSGLPAASHVYLVLGMSGNLSPRRDWYLKIKEFIVWHGQIMKDEAEINAVPQANMDHETQAADTGDEDQDLFEQLLSEYDYRAPRRGQILSGQIIRIAEDAILVDIGLKRDAVVPSREISLLDEEYLQKLQVGDEVVVYVLRPPAGDHDLLVSLSKGLEHESWSRAETYLEAGMILELEVSGFNKGGVLVDFENLRGFVPASQIPELRHAGDRQRLQQVKQNLVGTQMAVKVIEVDRQRNRLVFSALAAEEERRKKRLQELEPGQIVLRAKVASVVDFGIFVDLDGVDGLVHVSQLDWKMVKHPNYRCRCGTRTHQPEPEGALTEPLGIVDGEVSSRRCHPGDSDPGSGFWRFCARG